MKRVFGDSNQETRRVEGGLCGLPGGELRLLRRSLFSALLLGAVAVAESGAELHVQYANGEIEVVYSGKTWSGKVTGAYQDAKVVLGKYLAVESVISGTLTIWNTQLFELKSGKQIFDLAGGIISNDGRELIFIPQGAFIGQWSHHPTVYIFNTGDSRYKTIAYDLKARAGCGDEYDLTTPADDYKITKREIIFTRNDNCGRFKVVFPRP